MIDDKMRENRLRWYEYVLMRPPDVVVRRCEMTNIGGTRRGRERHKKALIKTINKDKYSKLN